MTEVPPLLPRRPRPPSPLDSAPPLSPPITLDTKVPHRAGTFRLTKKPSTRRAIADSGPLETAPLETTPLSPTFLWDQVPSGVTNPTYVAMSEDSAATQHSSDTDSIAFLEKTAPSLEPSGKELPPSRFPHVYEDVPEQVLEKNRRIVGTRDIFDSVCFGSPLTRRSSDSGYDVPRRSLPEAEEFHTFHVQRQLSASGVFYDFPGYRSLARKPSLRADPRDEGATSYDVPPGLTNLSKGDAAHNDLYDFPVCARSTPPLSERDSDDAYDVLLPAGSPSPPPLQEPSTFKDTVGSPPQVFLEANSENPAFRASYAYEVPKPRPVFPPPPPVEELYVTESVAECSPEDWEECDDIPLSPPPSYPPPPPPVLLPPAVPPRKTIPASPPRGEKIPGFRPVPAKRYSLAKRSPVVRSPVPSGEKTTLPAISTSPTDSPVLDGRKDSLRERLSKSSSTSSPPASPGRSSGPSRCSLSGGFESSASEFSFADPCTKWMEDLLSIPQKDNEEAFDDDPPRGTSPGTEDAKRDARRDLSGYVYKAETRKKGFVKRWCTLRDGCWSYFVSEKDSLPLGSLSAQDIAAVSVSEDGPSPATSTCPELWCFEIHALQSQGCRFLMGTSDAEDRRCWVQRLGEIIAPEAFMDGPRDEVLHLGRLHVKEGAGGFWRSACACLRGRELHLMEKEGAPEVLDLRKVMSVGKPEDASPLATRDSGPSFQLQLPGRTLYLRADHPSHTESWASSVRSAWTTPVDAPLSSQYLTSDGVPVSVDRCINFVSTYGTMLTGIYRLAGSSSKVKKLVAHMLQDPWTLHLTTEEYTPHDVANALKRYLRSFQDCLFTKALFARWVEAGKCERPAERRKLLKNLLEELPPINYQLLKKLVSHLKSISDHSDRNYMPVLNLAPVFGPSLLYGSPIVGSVLDVSSHGGSFEESNASMDIVADLIQDYCWFFEVDPEEIVKEKKIQEALDMFRDARIAQRPAGDMLVGVYVYSRDWGHCFNVKLSPAMTAGELCRHVISQLSIKEPPEEMAVFEVICNQDLERPLHHAESVLSYVLRWATWDASYAKDNYLCIKNNYVYQEISPLIMNHQPLSVFSELRYASPRQKSFKKAHFEFTGGKITHHKDSKRSAEASHRLNQWNIEDVTWYIGCDSKRSPPHRMNVTFVTRQGEMKRSKETPYFGNCLSLSSEEEFTRWLAAMLIAEFPSGILPPTPTTLPDVAS